MKVIYIAGAFRGPTAWDIAENIRKAERAGLEVAKLGAMPLIPHANTAHFHGALPDEFWLDGTLELLRRADAVYVFDPADIERSRGTRGEVEEAGRLDKPVCTTLAGLHLWLETGDTRGVLRKHGVQALLLPKKEAAE